MVGPGRAGTTNTMNPEDFDFPRGQMPSTPRSRGDCRLMVVDRENVTIGHYDINDLPMFLQGSEVWANDSYAKIEEQNVYSFKQGSHVLPSAGYYLTTRLVEDLELKTLTLHVGSPSEQVDINFGFQSNVGWREPYWMQGPPSDKKPITAIGTTVVKALETWARTGQLNGTSELFIQPPFEFLVVKKLLTNFHFPKECLLALTCAFGGVDLIREAYEEAVSRGYLFSDWGDRLLVL